MPLALIHFRSEKGFSGSKFYHLKRRNNVFDLRRAIVAGLVAVFLGVAPSAWAAGFVYGNLSMEIGISEMDSVDLTGFDIEIVYDRSMLDFSGYILTDELGSISDGEALDNSYEDDSFAPGTISLSVVSLLDDQDLASQSDDFVLATLYFWGDQEALSGVSVSSLDISIANVGLDAISFTIETATQSSSVPVPATMFLLGTGLVGLVGVSRCKKK